MSVISPEGLARLARRWYVATTGKQWRYASHDQRRRWWAHIEPLLRAEHGIATDAVYRDGDWHPPEQCDLFTSGEVSGDAR